MQISLVGRGHAEGHKNETQRGTGDRAWSFTDCMVGEISPKMCILMTGSSRQGHGWVWMVTGGFGWVQCSRGAWASTERGYKGTGIGVEGRKQDRVGDAKFARGQGPLEEVVGECVGQSGGLRTTGREELTFINETHTWAYEKITKKVRQPE